MRIFHAIFFTVVSAKDSRTPLQLDLYLHKHLGWTQWTQWSQCREVSCGQAFSTRIRFCQADNKRSCKGESVSKLSCPGKVMPPCDCYRYEPGEASYGGDVSVTTSGKICQPWSFQYPHRNEFTYMYPNIIP